VLDEQQEVFPPWPLLVVDLLGKMVALSLSWLSAQWRKRIWNQPVARWAPQAGAFEVWRDE